MTTFTPGLDAAMAAAIRRSYFGRSSPEWAETSFSTYSPPISPPCSAANRRRSWICRYTPRL
jgi:hypothetical protein